MIKRAVIHVENTENILELAQYLASAGWTILSANKTENLLRKEKIPVIREQTLVENNLYINDTSQLIRRILLSKYDNEEYAIQGNDENNIFLVCINLTPNTLFSQSQTPDARPTNFFLSTVLRNSFANYENVLILTDPVDYKEAIIQLKTDNITKEFRSYLAGKALNMASAYDSGLATTILQGHKKAPVFLNYLMYPYKKEGKLRAGSNPQQEACYYSSPLDYSILGASGKMNIKDLSTNLCTDISFAWTIISSLYSVFKNQFSVQSENSDGYEFTTKFSPLTGTVFTITVKCNCIVGAAVSTNVLDSFKKTFAYDTENIPDSVFACSAVIDGEAAKAISKCSFLAVIAPGYTDDAKEIFAQNKSMKLLTSSRFANINFSAKLLSGGLIIQDCDKIPFKRWRIRTKNRPSQYKTDEMAIGMTLAMAARSFNAVLLKENAIVGIAQGMPSTVKAIGLVLYEAQEYYKRQAKNGGINPFDQEVTGSSKEISDFGGNIPESANAQADSQIGMQGPDTTMADVLICDAPIPFCEPIKELISKGVTAIIQTGGTPSDRELIEYCDERGIVMVFTDMTHINF